MIARAMPGFLARQSAVAALPPAGPPQTQPKKRRRRSTPQPTTITRWLQKDVETAQHVAASGDLSIAGRLYRSLARDGTYQGLIGTRCNGLVRLPKRFAGDLDAIAFLEGCEGKPGAFEEIFPESELALFDADGIVLGVAVGEFIEIEGCDYPVFCRLDPEFLRYNWWEDRWYYASASGLLPITPGDGRWVLHTPGGRQEPWARGLWASLARAYVSKEHAIMLRENWNGKLANPARAAFVPPGASEPQRVGFLQRLIAWGVNTVFELPIGWDVKLIESNGRGYESFKETIADSNQEIMVAIAGQIVTVTGGSGFANAAIHATIRGDLIQGDGQSLADTLNRQAIPWLLRRLLGAGANATVSWDTRAPSNRKEEADSLAAAAKAIGEVATTLRAHGLEVDVLALAARFAVPLRAPRAIEELPVAPAANDDGAPVEEPLTVDSVAALAEQMTAAGIDRCEHGRANRCPLCGIERDRSFTLAADGSPEWRVAWKPIAREGVAA